MSFMKDKQLGDTLVPRINNVFLNDSFIVLALFFSLRIYRNDFGFWISYIWYKYYYINSPN